MNILVSGGHSRFASVFEASARHTDHALYRAENSASLKNMQIRPDIIVHYAQDACDLTADVISDVALKHEAVLIYVLDALTCHEDFSVVAESGCRHIVLIATWVYGFKDGPDLVMDFCESASSEPVLEVPVDQISVPTFAGDIISFIMDIIDDGLLDRQGIYEFSGEGVCSMYDLAWEICDIKGYLCDVMPCRSETLGASPFQMIPDMDPLKKTFGTGLPHWKDSLRFFLA